MRFFIILALLALTAMPAAAQVSCDASGCRATLTYTEPTTYTTGQPLKDLTEGVFTYQRDGGPPQTVKAPASSPQGGGVIALATTPQDIPPCTKATLTGSLVMHAKVAAPSAPAVPPPAVIDRTLLANGQPDPACSTAVTRVTLQCQTIASCVIEWAPVAGATQYRVVAGVALKTGSVVAVTAGTSATVEPSVGVSDYTVFATLGDGTVKMLPVRVTVLR